MSGLTQEQLKAILAYDPDTGIFRWRVDVARGCRGKAGSVAGTTNKHGYRVIVIRKRPYYAHRLTWLYVYGEWPSNTIDHANGERSFNAIRNLRAATVAENTRNSKCRRAAGLKGVYFHKQSGLWHAVIMTSGVKKSLGYFKTEVEGHGAYAAASVTDHGEFSRVK